MSISLSDLADNLSKINKTECKACMEGKNIKSECEFIRFKNNILNYRCKECGKRMLKVNKWIKQKVFKNAYQFCNGEKI